MRSVAGVAARVLAALGCLCGAGVAHAETAGDESVPRFLFYSGTDLWRFGAFMHGGVLWSPDGVNREGFTLKLLTAGGAYRYKAGARDVIGRQLLASVLPGWRFKQDRFETTVYLGLDLQDHRFSPDDIGNPLRGIHAGLRFAADAWFEPADAFMVAGAFSVSTIQTTYWGRAQLGGRIPGLGWVGPEAHLFSDLGYHQYSFGLHLTGFKTAEFEWSLGAGLVRDAESRTSPYGRIGLNVRQ
jgi:hypothetical protein